MTTARAQLHRDFVLAFHRGIAPLPVRAAELDAAEKTLSILFPESLRHLLLTHGALSTLSMAEMDVAPDHFFTPGEMVSSSRALWKAGLPDNLVAFAADHDQDSFCFERGHPARRPDDAEVWYYNPETGLSRFHVLFDEWLKELIAPVYEHDDEEKGRDEDRFDG